MTKFSFELELNISINVIYQAKRILSEQTVFSSNLRIPVYNTGLNDCLSHAYLRAEIIFQLSHYSSIQKVLNGI